LAIVDNYRKGRTHSVKQWHENGKKSFEAGKNKGEPNIFWNEYGIKECESAYDLTSVEDISVIWRFFDSDEGHISTINNTLVLDNYSDWEFFNKDSNKVFKYRHDYTKNPNLTADELWHIWLNSGCEELVKILNPIEKHRSKFFSV